MTKSDDAYREVRDRILRGDLPPGATLKQRALAAELGISTTPLREALRRLMTEGLVELDSHRDARITELRAEDARDLLELRRALDPLAAALAAERRSAEDLAEMRSALTTLAPLVEKPSLEHFQAHRRFHRAIYRAAHNDLLIASLDALWDRADRLRIQALTRGHPQRADVSAEHQALVDAIAERRAQDAARVMSEHIDGSLGAGLAQTGGQPGREAASAGS